MGNVEYIRNQNTCKSINKVELVDLLKKISNIAIKEKRICNRSEVECLILQIIKDMPNLIGSKNKFSLEEVSKDNNVSYSYLSKKFKELKSYNYTEYLNYVRINKVVDLLINSDIKIVDIALESSFASSKTFNNTFKKILKISPSEFRDKFNSLEKIFIISPLYNSKKL